MKKPFALFALATAAVVGGAAFSGAALAQGDTYPSKPVRVVVPYAPGGALDTVARLVAQRFGERLGQTFVIDNKPGANNIIGMESVVRAQPDGYTLLFAAAPIALNVALGIKQPFDVLKDLQPISLLATTPVIIATNPTAPYKNLKDIVAASRIEAKGLSYATAGVGSMPHLLGEAFRIKSGANLTHIGYKGSAPALQDVLGGTVPVMMDAYTPGGAQVSAGKLRGIAVASPKRLSILPDVPTTAEEGYPDMIGEAFYGLLAPSGTPPAVIEKLHAVAVAVSNEPEVRERLAKQGYDVVGSKPEEYAAYIRREISRWTETVKAAGIQP